MADDMLSVGFEDHIGTITLHAKTMPPALFSELESAVQGLLAKEELRVIVVRSDTKDFSYGLDLKAAFAEFGPLLTQAGLAGERERFRQLVHKLQAPLTALDEAPVPVLCAVHGRCIGGGLDLATACDIRLATHDATFSLREVKLAMVADIGSLQRLPGIVGRGVAREMAFTGKDVDADFAYRTGLVNHLFETREALWAAAHSMAQEIAGNPPLVTRGIKHVMRYGEDHSVRDGLDYVANWNSAFLASEDLKEAITAFMSKRDPVFTGK